MFDKPMASIFNQAHMTLTLPVGSSIKIEFADSDGAFVISFTETDIKVEAEMPGNVIGVEGLIHHEHFGDIDDSTAEKQPVIPNDVNPEPMCECDPAGISRPISPEGYCLLCFKPVEETQPKKREIDLDNPTTFTVGQVSWKEE